MSMFDRDNPHQVEAFERMRSRRAGSTCRCKMWVDAKGYGHADNCSALFTVVTTYKDGSVRRTEFQDGKAAHTYYALTLNSGKNIANLEKSK